MPFAGDPSRSEPLKTRKGLVLHYDGNDQWKVDYPEDESTRKDKRIGGATTIKVMALIYYLARGHTISEADRLAFE